jgi:hypothetical protein
MHGVCSKIRNAYKILAERPEGEISFVDKGINEKGVLK